MTRTRKFAPGTFGSDPTACDLAFLRELATAGGTMPGVRSFAATSPKVRAVREGWATKAKRAFTVFGLARTETAYTLTDAGRAVLAATKGKP